jgi:hypothetical protein
MAHSIFGYSYPPGCSGPPDDDPGPCLCCGGDPAGCDCPECPVCGEAGNPECYVAHGLAYSEAQTRGREAMQARMAEEARAENEFWSQFQADEDAYWDQVQKEQSEKFSP